MLLGLASPLSPRPAANLSLPNPTGGTVPCQQCCCGGDTVLVPADAPQAPSFTSLVEPQGGRQAVLLCTVDSCPPSDIVLHRGPGHPVASTRGPADPRVTVQVTPNSLRVGLGALGPRDAGLYVCSANNSFGTASSSLRLDLPGEGGPEPR